MKIEELKEACGVLTRVLGCHKTSVIDCRFPCDTCPNNYSNKDEDRALDTAITVIGDVIKQMEKMTTREVLTTNDISN